LPTQPPERILVLGGTAEARELATALHEKGIAVTTSLAGVTRDPLLPSGKVRSGGFGGAEGLQGWVTQNAMDCIVDATHPFAARISRHAHEAATNSGIPLFRLERPAWQPGAADRWTEAEDLPSAAAQCASGARVMLTTGRRGLESFFTRLDLCGVVRMVEPPDTALPQGWSLLLDRPPYGLPGESALFTRESITVLVTKNAGGAATAAKLQAARQLQIEVLMIRRPAKPDCSCFPTVTTLLAGLGF
jgi:precorrin-6A/cobalt-precorrin-6A reductase